MGAAVFDQKYPTILLQQQNILTINPERRAKAVMELIQPDQSVKCHQIALPRQMSSKPTEKRPPKWALSQALLAVVLGQIEPGIQH